MVLSGQDSVPQDPSPSFDSPNTLSTQSGYLIPPGKYKLTGTAENKSITYELSNSHRRQEERIKGEHLRHVAEGKTACNWVMGISGRKTKNKEENIFEDTRETSFLALKLDK